jgi:hypothetical protein
LIIYLATAKNKLFLIEELENDIHPEALKQLLELIIEKSDGNQFIITTHSNIVMKYLGACEETKILQVTMELNKDGIPTSSVKDIKTSNLFPVITLGYTQFPNRTTLVFSSNFMTIPYSKLKFQTNRKSKTKLRTGYLIIYFVISGSKIGAVVKILVFGTGCRYGKIIDAHIQRHVCEAPV